MTDGVVTFLGEVRYWRAAVVTGCLLLCSTLLMILHLWPEMADGSVFSKEVLALASGLGVGVMLALGLALGLLLGGLWCGAGFWVLTAFQRIVVRFLPLTTGAGAWRWRYRWFCPVWLSELNGLQTAMNAVSEYQDLEHRDREFAYRQFFDEVLRSPMSVVGADASLVAVATRSLETLRLLCGLIVWLPAVVLMLRLHIASEFGDLGNSLLVMSAVLFLAVLCSLVVETRRATTLVVRCATQPAQLAHYAKHSMYASRSRGEIEAAEQALE